MNKKTSLVIALSAMLLVGCGEGDEEARPANNPSNEGEVQDDVQNEGGVQEDIQDAGPRADEEEGVNENAEETPMEEGNEMIGDDEFDMPDTQGQKEEETDLNK